MATIPNKTSIKSLTPAFDNIEGRLRALERIHIATAISAAGPLPVSGQFTSYGGSVFLYAAGSGWQGTANTLLAFKLTVDGTDFATGPVIYCNTANVHIPCVPVIVPIGVLKAGVHTVQLSINPAGGTPQTDANDRFRVTAFEVPS
jgi:hypothetical protein